MSADRSNPPRYGNKDWFDQQYRRVGDDPWGLTWRPSQQVRYGMMLNCLQQAVTANDLKFERVLDIGCALGDFTALLGGLVSDESRVTGVDVSNVAIQRVRQRHPGIHFIQAELDELAGKHAGRYDLITCLEVLYYIDRERRQATVERLAALLKPGGIMLASSLLSKSHFLEREFVQLIGSELDVLETDVVCMGMVNAIEKLVLKLGKLAGGRWGRRQTSRATAFGSWRFKAAGGLERFSKRFLTHLAASHVFVLARKP